MNDGPKFVLTINSSYEQFVESGRVKKELWRRLILRILMQFPQVKRSHVQITQSTGKHSI